VTYKLGVTVHYKICVTVSDETESDALCVAQVRAALRQHRRFVSNTLRQMKARVSDRLLRYVHLLR